MEQNFETALMQIRPMIRQLSWAVKIPGMGHDDVQQELELEAWLSWKAWDRAAGTKFSTYAYRRISNRRKILVRKAYTMARGGGQWPASLDAPIIGTEGDSGSLGETIPDPGPSAERIAESKEIRLAIRRALSGVLDQNIRRFLSEILDGSTQTAAARRCRLSQSLASYHYRRFKERLRQELSAC